MPDPQFFSAPDLSDSSRSHQIAYYEYGDSMAEKVVVCVHGLTRNASDFDYLARSLAQQGRRVLAVDIAGRGKSEELRNPKDYSYLQYVADCVALLDNFHLRSVDWIGTSMGGIIGMMIAAQHKGRINRMVLNDIGSHVPAEALQVIVDYVQESLRAYDSRDEAETQLRNNLQGFGITKDEHWKHVFEHGICEKAGKWYFACSSHILDAMREDNGDIPPVEAIDLSFLWEEIAIPVYVVRGEHSELLSMQTVQAMRAVNPRCRLQEVAGAGHAPALFDAKDYEPMIRWLNHSGLPSGLI